MATTTLTIGNELISTTMHILMKEWKDGLHTSVAFLEAHDRHNLAVPGLMSRWG